MFNELTVIIPTYNRSEVVLKSLRSLENLKPIRYKLIVVDDSSTDSTVSVCKSFIRENNVDGIVLTLDSNSGPSRARNLGIENANTEWVIFLDSDDEYLKGAGENILQSLISNPEIDLHTFSYNVNGFKSPSYSDEENAFFYFLKKKFFNTNTCVFKKSCLKEDRYNEMYRVGEDTDFWARLLYRCTHKHTNISIAQYHLEHKVRVPDRHPFYDETLEKLDISIEIKKEVYAFYKKSVFLQKACLRKISVKEIILNRNYKALLLYIFGDKSYDFFWRVQRCLKSKK